MPDYRCPKHDRVFETVTDQRKPGAGATATLPAHPVNGHPDCPLCQAEASPANAAGRTVVSNAGA
jgi:hypothetical protein